MSCHCSPIYPFDLLVKDMTMPNMTGDRLALKEMEGTINQLEPLKVTYE